MPPLKRSLDLLRRCVFDGGVKGGMAFKDHTLPEVSLTGLVLSDELVMSK